MQLYKIKKLEVKIILWEINPLLYHYYEKNLCLLSVCIDLFCNSVPKEPHTQSHLPKYQ